MLINVSSANSNVGFGFPNAMFRRVKAPVCRNPRPHGILSPSGGSAEGMDGVSDLLLPLIQIDGVHIEEDMTLVAAAPRAATGIRSL